MLPVSTLDESTSPTAPTATAFSWTRRTISAVARMSKQTLVEAAPQILNAADPADKARLGEDTGVSVATSPLPIPRPRPSRPRPTRPPPSHDIIARFGKVEPMPNEFFTDYVKVARDEGRHFRLSIAARLQELGSYYGALPAHDGLWDSAIATVEHCVQEVPFFQLTAYLLFFCVALMSKVKL